MNKKMLIPYLFLLLGAFTSAFQSAYHSSDVIAREPLEYYPLAYATAYPTLTPIGNTPTPISLDQAVDFSCPMGIPVGFGAITPSTDWLYACGQCLPTFTPVPFETSTAGPTRTPLIQTSVPPVCVTGGVGTPEVCTTSTVPPTSVYTSTPTSTITSTPSSYTAITCISDCNQVNAHTINLIQSGVYYSDFTTGAFLFPVYRRPVNTPLYIYVRNMQFDIVNIGPSNTKRIGFSATHWGTSLRTTVSLGNTASIGGGGSTIFTPADISFTSTTSDLSVQNMSSRVQQSQNQGTQNGIKFDFTASYEIWVSSAPIDFVSTPTPSMTPTTIAGGTFCGSISNANVPNQFQLGGTGGIVYQDCVTIPEINFELIFAWLFPDWLLGIEYYLIEIFPIDAVIDPLTVCIRTRDYSLYIFGYRMPIEFMLGLGVFLSAFRFFTPSVFSGTSVLGQGNHGTTNNSPTPWQELHGGGKDEK